MARIRFGLIGCVLLSLALVVIAGCAGKRPRTAHDPYRFIQDHNLGSLPRFDIPVEVNDRVVAWMEYFQGPGRGHFRRYLERSGRYVPLMYEILKKNGMPSDLVYVAMIESGFNTQARSWASAVGPWQFIASTGRRYGLKIDSWVDERRDPYKSTQAAVDYFRDLYGEFGDWYLAMAGYNGGEGRVRNAISSTGSRNFWEMGSAFRPETRDYVPKFIAAALMAKMPERFGFEKIDYKTPFNYETAEIETQTDIPVIAQCAGVSEEDIVDLNPHLVGGTTPPYERNYHIRLPKGTSHQFREKYAALPQEERIQVVRYEVRKGDTLARVARRYGVSAATLARANGLSLRQKRIPVGMELTIPRNGRAAQYAKASSDDAIRQAQGKNYNRSENRKATAHIVRRGESVASIARRYGVSPKQLMVWNGIRSDKKLRAGARLVLKGSPEKRAVQAASLPEESNVETAVVSGKEHRVVKGETLATIANRYGVTVKQLLALNNIPNAKHLRPGQSIMIRKPKAMAGSKELAIAEDARSGINKTETPKGQVVASKIHKVGKGETISAIASKYGITTKELLTMNGINNPKGLRPGETLVVKKGGVVAKDKRQNVASSHDPIKLGGSLAPENASEPLSAPASALASSDAAGAPVAMPQDASVEAPVPSSSFSDSMLPEQTDSTAVDLRERDVQSSSLSKTSTVASADTKRVGAQEPSSSILLAKTSETKKEAASESSVNYKVKNGDTLWDIARRHKVTIAQIQKWNSLADPSAVKPGATLTIHRE